MEYIDFTRFKIKNPDYTAAFEDLCYHLFCREFKVPGGARADFNEVGLETKPVAYEGKYYGFQSKFFEHRIDGGQIEESIKKALYYFAGKLDVI